MNKFGKLLKMFFIFAFLVQVIDASNAIVAYRSSTIGEYCSTNGQHCPKIRFWDSENLTWGDEIELPTSGYLVSWPMLKQSPVSEKMVLTIISGSGSGNYVHSYVCLSDCENPASWEFTEKVKNVGALAQKRMDMEFIGNTDEVMLVFGSSSTVGIKYKIYSEDETDFLQGTEETVPGSEGKKYTWMKLSKNPTNDEMILVGYNSIDTSNGIINAWVWDGTTWGNQIEITDKPYIGTSETYVKFDIGYLQDGSKAYVFANENNCGVTWRELDGASWSEKFEKNLCSDSGNHVRDVIIRSNPTKNEIRALISSGKTNNEFNLYEMYLNESSSTFIDNRILNNDLWAFSTRLYDFAYLPDYSKGALVFNSKESSHTNIKTMESLFGITLDNINSNYDFEHKGFYLSLYTNPSDEYEDKILGLRYVESTITNMYQLGSFHYNGTTLINHGESILAENVGTDKYEPYSLTYLHPHNISIKIEEESIIPSIGEILEFNITIENNGVYNLTNFEIVSELPVELTFDESNLSYTKSGNKIKWIIPELGKGESIVIQLNATINENAVSLNEQTKEITTNVKINKKTSMYNVNEESSVNTTIHFVGLLVEKESLNIIAPYSGEIAMWKINITNVGDLKLNITEIVDNSPMGFRYNNSEPSADYVNQYINIYWSPNEILNPGESKVIYLNTTIIIDILGTYTNKVSVLARTESGHEMTFTGNGTIETCGMSVDVTKTVNKNEFYVGDVITFTLNVTNDGDRNANILNIIDTLPEGVTFLGANNTPFSVSGNEIIWGDIDMLPIGDSFIVEYNVSANQVGEFINEVSLTAQSLCGCTIDKVSNVSFEIIKKSGGSSSSGGGSSSSSREIIKVSKEVLCPNNVLVISVTTTRGTPVKGIGVKLYQKTPYYELISEQITDNKGKAYYFIGERNGNYEIMVSGSGYVNEILEFRYEVCEEMECKFNSDCANEKYCLNGMCIKVEEGKCGYIKEHTWVSYECCEKENCDYGYECKNNVCVEIVEPSVPGITEGNVENMEITYNILQNIINLIKRNGGNVNEIERILEESKENYELENYEMAMELATRASNLIESTEIEGKVIVEKVEVKEETNALLYVLVGVMGTLFIIGVVYFFTKRK